MRLDQHRPLLAATALASAAAVAAALAAAPGAQAGVHRLPASSPAPAAAAVARVDAAAASRVPQAGRERVIVLLRPTIASARWSATVGSSYAADEAGVASAAATLGVHTIRRFSTIDAFSATASAAAVARLKADPAVRAVVADLVVPRPSAPVVDGGAGAASGSGAGIPVRRYCSTTPSAPRLEPEALQTMHVAYDNPYRASAADFANGAGVKVAFLADGLDPNNPDFLRPNGSHVFIDYKDFTGEGRSAVTEGAEAFGDASSIAAQARHTYNLGTEQATAAYPLPKGCYIRVRGVAPAAALVGLKVFGAKATFTSNFVAALDYAVATDHVNVINESFGSNPYPDTLNDPISLANSAAIAAGVTVVASTGDSGTTSTLGSPATSPDVLGVAATTNRRASVQLKAAGVSNPALHLTGWADDNISSFSSGGYSLQGKVPDVAAPGDSGWALCSKNIKIYTGCANIDGAGSSVLDFAGTSQSSPLTAGTAALVIQAYRRAHHGATPTPAVVKSIIVGTARDLDYPAYEQGSGEVDALAAVRAAMSMPTGRGDSVPRQAAGVGLVTSVAGAAGLDQLDLHGAPGTSVTGRFTVTNASPVTQRLALTTRALTRVLSFQRGTLRLNPAQTFPNVVGSARAYQLVKVRVPRGADRLQASIAYDGKGQYAAFEALIDPAGVYQAYNAPGGNANFSNIDASHPAAGVWTAMIWANPALTGAIHYRFSSSRNERFGSVSPASLTLAAGASAVVRANFPTATDAGDMSAAVVVDSSRGTRSVMPVAVRTMIATPRPRRTSSFTGVVTGGNGGNGGASSAAQADFYYLDVPRGQRGLAVRLRLDGPQPANQLISATLLSPDGQTPSAVTNVVVGAKGLEVGRRLFTFVQRPMAGRWALELEFLNPAAGDVVSRPFTGTVSFEAAPIATAASLPTSSTVLATGSVHTYGVIIHNTTGRQQIYFADPRLDRNTTYRLASQVPGRNLQHLTLPTSPVTPQWLVPSGTSRLVVTARANRRIQVEAGTLYGDPDSLSAGAAKTASVRFDAAELSNGQWFGQAAEIGPFTSPPPEGTVAVNARATTQAFDKRGASSLGDYWRDALIAPQPGPSGSGPSGSGPSGSGSSGRRSAAHLGAGSAYLAEQARAADPIAALGSVAAAASGAAVATGGAVPACNPRSPILAAGASCRFVFAVGPNAPVGRTVEGHLGVQLLDPYTLSASPMSSFAYGYTVGVAPKVTVHFAGEHPAFGMPVVARVSVGRGNRNASGTVRLLLVTTHGTVGLDSAELVGGRARLVSTPRVAGKHVYRVVYRGDRHFAAATSTAQTITVG